MHPRSERPLPPMPVAASAPARFGIQACVRRTPPLSGPPPPVWVARPLPARASLPALPAPAQMPTCEPVSKPAVAPTALLVSKPAVAPAGHPRTAEAWVPVRRPGQARRLAGAAASGARTPAPAAAPAPRMPAPSVLPTVRCPPVPQRRAARLPARSRRLQPALPPPARRTGQPPASARPIGRPPARPIGRPPARRTGRLPASPALAEAARALRQRLPPLWGPAWPVPPGQAARPLCAAAPPQPLPADDTSSPAGPEPTPVPGYCCRSSLVSLQPCGRGHRTGRTDRTD